MTQQEPLAALKEIRSIMERSTRYTSLSGLSGICAGIASLAGAGAVAWYLQQNGLRYTDLINGTLDAETLLFLSVTAALVFLLTAGTAYYFTYLKAKRIGQPVGHSQGQRLVLNLAIPLAAGGVFCLLLLHHGILYLIVPAMLIFYGLALINSSKYTFGEIRYLGLCQLALGLLTGYFVDYGLLTWTLGFGLLNIVYGARLYTKYEKA